MGTYNHISVLPKESINALNLRQGGIYIDGTLGGGGHSSLILENLPKGGRLIGIDRDINAINAANSRLVNENFQVIQDNFLNIPEILKNLSIFQVDGVLLDLGVSSHQLDTAERGFSYRMDGMLDMRMDTRTKLTAYDIVNAYSEKDLANLLFTYGEERNSRRISRAICKARESAPIETTLQLVTLIESVSPRRKRGETHPATRSFMALRIKVNDELNPLANALKNIVECLAVGGRIAVITFHSLEDRIVKNTFQELVSPCKCPRDIPYCVCHKKPQLKLITRKPIVPSDDELIQNSRAHSAKLRIAEKI